MDTNPKKLSQYTALVYPALFVVAYFAAAEIGHVLSFPGNFASFWPPSGLYVAVLLLNPYRRWPLLILAACVGNLTSDVGFHGKSVPVSLAFSAGNTLEAVAGAWLLLRYCGRPFTLGPLKDTLAFFVCSAMLSPAFGASVGAATVVTAFGGAYWSVWVTWYISGVIGVLVVAPLVLSLLGKTSDLWPVMRPHRVVEAIVLMVGLVLAVELIFHQTHALVWGVAPFLLWAALRYEAAGVSLAVAVVAVLAVWHTTHGLGPFAKMWPVDEKIVMVQSFASVLAISFLTVAAVVRERRVSQQAVMLIEQRLRDLFENTPDMAHCVGPDGRLRYVNRAWLDVMGYTEQEISSLTLFQLLHPDEVERVRPNLQRVLAGEKLEHVTVRLVTKSGNVLWTEGSVISYVEDGQRLAIRIFKDVTERINHQREVAEYQRQLKKANARLELLATTDGLTHVKNRRAFQEKLAEEIKRSFRTTAPLSLLLMDVDQFKEFNDTFGHPAGDGALRGVARLLEENARATDFVARYGGEEFVVVLVDTDQHQAVTAAERFRKAVEGGAWRKRPITVSIGVATLTPDDMDGTVMLERADAGLYRAKKHGRNCVRTATESDRNNPSQTPHHPAAPGSRGS